MAVGLTATPGLTLAVGLTFAIGLTLSVGLTATPGLASHQHQTSGEPQDLEPNHEPPKLHPLPPPPAATMGAPPSCCPRRASAHAPSRPQTTPTAHAPSPTTAPTAHARLGPYHSAQRGVRTDARPPPPRLEWGRGAPSPSPPVSGSRRFSGRVSIRREAAEPRRGGRGVVAQWYVPLPAAVGAAACAVLSARLGRSRRHEVSAAQRRGTASGERGAGIGAGADRGSRLGGLRAGGSPGAARGGGRISRTRRGKGGKWRPGRAAGRRNGGGGGGGNGGGRVATGSTAGPKRSCAEPSAPPPAVCSGCRSAWRPACCAAGRRRCGWTPTRPTRSPTPTRVSGSGWGRPGGDCAHFVPLTLDEVELMGGGRLPGGAAGSLRYSGPTGAVMGLLCGGWALEGPSDPFNSVILCVLERIGVHLRHLWGSP